MNKGDTISFILDYTYNGEPLGENDFSEIELQFNEEWGTHKNVKLLMSKGSITWDNDIGKFVAKLDQCQTIGLTGVVSYQLRLLDAENNEVASSSIGYFTLGDSLSKKVLTLPEQSSSDIPN